MAWWLRTLPRADWPVTRLDPGATFAFAYQTTIPHEGTFTLYVTRDGYDPKAPLAWSDLETRPFLSVADPPTATTKPAPKPAVAHAPSQSPSATEPPPVPRANPEPVASTSVLPLIGGGAVVIVFLGALFALLLHRKRGGSHRKLG